MRILITGGLGYLGQVISQHLTEHEIEIVDIKDGKDYRDIERIEADAVVHLAAIVGDQACRLNPEKARETNFKDIKRLISTCKLSGVRRFIFASTCSIYGQDSIATCYEAGQINPLSLYATTKYAAERLLIEAADANFNPIILRFGTAFGQSPAMRYNLVLNKFAKEIKENNKITIYGGDQFRPFIHVFDIYRVISKLLAMPIHGWFALTGQIFNIASENVCLKYLGHEIAQWYPKTIVVFNHECTDKRSYKVSTKKANKFFRYYPIVSIKEGLKEMIEHE